MAATDLEQIVNLAKRRGFVYPTAEIYGGFRSSYDYGPLGSLMLRNVREAWIRAVFGPHPHVRVSAQQLPGVDRALVGAAGGVPQRVDEMHRGRRR